MQQRPQRQVARLAEGILVRGIGQFLERRVHRQFGALDHGLEQLGLAAKVPVDRAAGDACGIGDLGQGRVADALFAEHALGGVE